MFVFVRCNDVLSSQSEIIFSWGACVMDGEVYEMRIKTYNSFEYRLNGTFEPSNFFLSLSVNINNLNTPRTSTLHHRIHTKYCKHKYTTTHRNTSVQLSFDRGHSIEISVISTVLFPVMPSFKGI